MTALEGLTGAITALSSSIVALTAVVDSTLARGTGVSDAQISVATQSVTSLQAAVDAQTKRLNDALVPTPIV